MRAFVTGGTGFIGSRLTKHLLADGVSTSLLVRSETTPAPLDASRLLGRLEDREDRLAELMRGHDILYHLAACISFDSDLRETLLAVNGEGTRRILSAARRAGVARCVVVSSACTMGLSEHPGCILDEASPFDMRLERRNPYLDSKRVCERHAFAAAASGQDVVIVNPTTVFGEGDQRLNSGTLIQQVAHSRVLPVPPGGSNVIDVDDVVEGILAAAERGRSGKRYILGGLNLKFGEIIDRIALAVGHRPCRIPLLSAARLPMISAAWLMQRLTRHRLITPQIIADTFTYKYYSSRLAETELAWKARRDFSDSLASAWRYYRREGLIAPPRGVAA